jgi:hypothetical protein
MGHIFGVSSRQNMPGVFISYPYQEKEKAELLATTLESRGLAPWLAHRDIPAGARWQDQLRNKLDSCDAFVLLIEPTTKPSSWLQLEYAAALESVWKHDEKVLIPVLTGKGEPPVFLRHFNVLRIPSHRKDWRAFSERIADTIKGQRKTDASAHISGDLKKKWKLRLDEVGSSALRIQAEDILEGAKHYLAANEPTDRRAIDLLSAQFESLTPGAKGARRTLRRPSKKQTSLK